MEEYVSQKVIVLGDDELVFLSQAFKVFVQNAVDVDTLSVASRTWDQLKNPLDLDQLIGKFVPKRGEKNESESDSGQVS